MVDGGTALPSFALIQMRCAQVMLCNPAAVGVIICRWGLALGSLGMSVFICYWCLWLRHVVHLQYPWWVAVTTVFDPIQKAVLWLVRNECYLPTQKRLLLLAWDHSVAKPPGTLFILLMSGCATWHSSITFNFFSFPRKEEAGASCPG